MTCQYCESPASLVDGTVIYPHRPDLAARRFWHCAPCDAYVSCHNGTDRAMGRLANAELRKARMEAHAAFDALWRNGQQSRNSAYRWLAEVLEMPKAKCHIALFGVEDCRRVVDVLARPPATRGERKGR